MFECLACNLLQISPLKLCFEKLKFRAEEAPVNSMSFIWNDNMREKREANANAT